MTLQQLLTELLNCELAIIVKNNGAKVHVFGKTAQRQGNGVVVEERNTNRFHEDWFPFYVDPEDVKSVLCADQP